MTLHLRDTSRLKESSQYWSQKACWCDPCLNLYGVLRRLIFVPHSSHLLAGIVSNAPGFLLEYYRALGESRVHVTPAAHAAR